MTKKTRVRTVATQGSSSGRALPSSQFDLNTWMISVPTPPSAEEVEARQDWIFARYPEDVVQTIVEAARFKDPQIIWSIRIFLQTAGEIFKDKEYDRLPTQSFASDKNYLQQIAVLARDLEAKIGAMNPIQAECFWHPMKQMHVGPASGRTFKTSFGLTVTERSWPDQTFVVEHLRPHQIIEAIQVVRNLATDASGSLRNQRGGRNTFPALDGWIRNAQRFWRAHSKSAFTPVMAKGQPASPALAFCYLALRQLNGNIQPTQIASAMRKLNKKFPDSMRASRVRQKPR